MKLTMMINTEIRRRGDRCVAVIFAIGINSLQTSSYESVMAQFIDQVKPFKKQLIELTTISLSRQIGAPTEKVWDVISTPGHLAQCHPFCEENPVKNWSGVGSQDTVYFYSGNVLNRYCKEWIKGLGYDLHLTFPNLDTEAEAIFRISSGQDVTNSVLSITLVINVPQYFPW